jgi:NADH:ubiquinone oxidoreductase subunit D
VDDPRVILPPKTAAMNDMESMIHHFKVVMEGVRAPVGESWFSVESSKGELGMYVVSDGGSKPVRWRVRGPSFINIAALPHMIEGALLSDVIAVNASAWTSCWERSTDERGPDRQGSEYDPAAWPWTARENPGFAGTPASST